MNDPYLADDAPLPQPLLDRALEVAAIDRAIELLRHEAERPGMVSRHVRKTYHDAADLLYDAFNLGLWNREQK